MAGTSKSTVCMEWTGLKTSGRIIFNVTLRASETLRCLGFIYLIKQKFNGRDREVLRRRDNKTPVALIDIEFKDYLTTSDAVAHCAAHLDDCGCVRPDYVGALEKADPSLRHTGYWLNSIKELPLTA